MDNKKLHNNNPEKEGGWDIQLPKLTLQTVLIGTIVIGFLINQYLMQRLKKTNIPQVNNATSTTNSIPKPLTTFDQNLITEQKKNGTPVSEYGSQHVHADLKIFINGQWLDLAKPENYVKARFMHIEYNPQNIVDSGSVLHLHAQYVPLKFFFTTLGMKLEKESLTLQDGQILKNENGKILTFYLDGKKVDELGDYSFQDLDKLLISYGPENNPEIKDQINSVTNFAKDHSPQ